jgi:hypothetical protein
MWGRLIACPAWTEILLRKTIALFALFFGVMFLLAETPTAQKKKSTSKAPSKSAKSTSKTSSSKKKSSSKKTVTRASWRNTQRTPTPERYKEIQQALATKGYLQTAAPSGVWDANSVEALKKFQQDQNLDPSGKLDSLSLIALGLGPKRDPQATPQP